MGEALTSQTAPRRPLGCFGWALVVTALLFVAGCADGAGHERGYEEGYEDGYADGHVDAETPWREALGECNDQILNAQGTVQTPISTRSLNLGEHESHHLRPRLKP